MNKFNLSITIFRFYGNHELCQDYSFWSAKKIIDHCIDGSFASRSYPYARKCTAVKNENKEVENSDACGNFKVQSPESDKPVNLDICPNSIESQKECEEKGNFFCKNSKSCIKRSQVCDGVVHCLDGMDEDFELCQHTFPETASFKCEEKNRDRYYVITGCRVFKGGV